MILNTKASPKKAESNFRMHRAARYHENRNAFLSFLRKCWHPALGAPKKHTLFLAVEWCYSHMNPTTKGTRHTAPNCFCNEADVVHLGNFAKRDHLPQFIDKKDHL
jgi:hypothetical protein